MSQFRFLIISLFCFMMCQSNQAQNIKVVKKSLSSYLLNYVNPAYTTNDKFLVEDLVINSGEKALTIYLNDAFFGQPFTPETVQSIYEQTRSLLPETYQAYQLTICAGIYPIEDLIPINLSGRKDTLRTYQKNIKTTAPWVKPISQPYNIRRGLKDRHLCVWASHGAYYKNNKREWGWQRPPLFCTTEDLFTQTIVLPYLIPMLQNAGAIVFSPRERDWQKNEVIVDNDNPMIQGIYTEINEKHEWIPADTGFAQIKDVYLENENPFKHGTARMAESTSGNRLSSIIWTPCIQESGDYAVYVSYKTLPESVDDAVYTVIHQGIHTRFSVNQQMGGGTWVYLGTFHFDAGENTENCVILTNQSDRKGIITADAVRFGGGMGNIARKDSLMNGAIRSGLPRFLEAARYSAQWAGMPYELYSPRLGIDDYSDDINVRTGMENLLSQGSDYHPGDSGLNVPIEMSIGCHSDAGARPDNTLVGTLGIYTSKFYEGKTAAGLSRLTSRDLIDIIMTQVKSDLTMNFGTWNRRQMWDRNYGETREPQFPAVILEMLSHQNWADMRLGHDPYFKFILARSIYKGILKYMECVHCSAPLIPQPMPVINTMAEVENNGSTVNLSWEPTVDLSAPESEPTHYIIYMAEGEHGFDNGTMVEATSCQFKVKIKPSTLYRFRVVAFNDGGCSLPGDEVCAYYSSSSDKHIMLVDGFHRLASPLPFDTETTGGFDMNADPGVIDNRMPGYCGYQLCFDKKHYTGEGANGFGYSGNELSGMILAGNTHDYTTRHAIDILSMGAFNISSCHSGALEKSEKLSRYEMIDLILGAQKMDGYSLTAKKSFTPEMRRMLTAYTQSGGSVLVSGAFIGSDMLNSDEQEFVSSVLKYVYEGSICTDSINSVQGLNSDVTIYGQPNEQNYWIRQVDALRAVNGSFPTMLYTQNKYAAAIAYQGHDYRTMCFGFPLECIKEVELRRQILNASVIFLTNKP